jgi:hypothetical protein
MHTDSRFQTTYLALIALAWNALEHIDQQLTLHPGALVKAEQQSKLQLLRLEMLQLGEKSRSCAGSRLVSTSQNVLIQRLVAKLLGWLDFDAMASAEVARMRIWSAQNWLFEEARRCEQIESGDYEVRLG